MLGARSLMKLRLIFLAIALAIPFCSAAENWPQWRGPFFNGSTTEQGLPIQWSKTNNVAWVAPLPGYSAATPVVWEDSVFVSSPDAQKNLLLICLDRRNGHVRWQQTVGAGDREKGRNNFASPSPVTDGKHVFILFATGDLAAYDFSGKKIWARDLAKEYHPFSIQWIYGSSPMLYKGKLYVQVLQRGGGQAGYFAPQGEAAQRESFLLCVDPETGKDLWRHIRATDAIRESQEAYTTPIPLEGKDGTEVIVVGGDYVTAHRTDTGAELWRCGGLNVGHESSWRIVPTPVVADGLVIACAPKRDPVLAIKDGGRGLVTESNIVWKLEEYTADCVTPLVYQNRLFVLDGDHQMMTCLEPGTGRTKWRESLGVRDIFRASPTGADGKIYCVSESGTVVVLSAGEDFRILASFPMGESPVRSSIAVAQGNLFIRTAENLYAVRGNP